MYLHLKNPSHFLIYCWKKQVIYLLQFSVSACANQPPGFSVKGTSTPNGLFQTITGLKILIGYTKRLHHGELFHLNVHYYLPLRNLPLHKRIIDSALKSFSFLPFPSLPMPKSVHVWLKLDNEVST